MITQAIVVKFFGPGNVRGSQYKATAYSGSVTVLANDSLSAEENARAAAMELVDKFLWPKKGWSMGALPDRGYVLVRKED